MNLLRELLEAEGIPRPGWQGRNSAILRLAWRMLVELAVFLFLLFAVLGAMVLLWAGADIPSVR